MKILAGMALVAVLALNTLLGVVGLTAPRYSLPADVVRQQALDNAVQGVDLGEQDVVKLCEGYLRSVGENNGLKIKGFKSQDPVFTGDTATIKTVVKTDVQPFNLTCVMQKSNWYVVTAK